MKKTFPLLCAFLFAFLLGPAWAGQAGEITHLSGVLSVIQPDGSAKLLSVKSQVNEGDTLATEADTYARIKFIDGAELVLRPNSRFRVDNYRYDAAKPENDGVLTSLLKGGMRAVTGVVAKRNKEKVGYRTPTATIGIRGTHFGALYCQGDCQHLRNEHDRIPRDGLHVDVTRGRIALANAAGSVEFGAGEFAYVQDANTLPLEVPLEDGFRVTIPSAIAANQGTGNCIGTPCAVACVID